MKKILTILSVLVLCSQGFSQRVNNMSTGSLIDANDNDSLFVTLTTNNFNGVYAFTSGTTADTVTTGWVIVDGANADITLEFGMVNASGTDNVKLNFEAFRGYGTPDSSGISRHLLQTFTNVNDTTLTYHLSDSTFISKRLFSKYRFTMEESGNQRNVYIVNVNQYSPEGLPPKIVK